MRFSKFEFVFAFVFVFVCEKDRDGYLIYLVARTPLFMSGRIGEERRGPDLGRAFQRGQLESTFLQLIISSQNITIP